MRNDGREWEWLFAPNWILCPADYPSGPTGSLANSLSLDSHSHSLKEEKNETQGT